MHVELLYHNVASGRCRSCCASYLECDFAVAARNQHMRLLLVLSVPVTSESLGMVGNDVWGLFVRSMLYPGFTGCHVLFACNMSIHRYRLVKDGGMQPRSCLCAFVPHIVKSARAACSEMGAVDSRSALAHSGTHLLTYQLLMMRGL